MVQVLLVRRNDSLIGRKEEGGGWWLITESSICSTARQTRIRAAKSRQQVARLLMDQGLPASIGGISTPSLFVGVNLLRVDHTCDAGSCAPVSSDNKHPHRWECV